MNMLNNSFYLGNLRYVNKNLNKYSEILSTGKRINKASDDVVGSSMVTRLNTKINHYNASNENIKKTQSVLETIDSTIEDAEGIAMKMKDITIQAQNDTLTVEDRANLQTELDGLKTTYDELIANADINNINYLNVAGNTYSVNTGMGNFSISSKNMTSVAGGVIDFEAMDLSTTANANAAQTKIEASLESLIDTRSYYGAKMNILSERADLNRNQGMEASKSKSRIEDADMAKASSEFSRYQILHQTNLDILMQRDSINYNILSLFNS